MALTDEKQRYPYRTVVACKKKWAFTKERGLDTTHTKQQHDSPSVLPSHTPSYRHMHNAHPTEHMLITIKA
jgi:hypothetical protein